MYVHSRTVSHKWDEYSRKSAPNRWYTQQCWWTWIYICSCSYVCIHAYTHVFVSINICIYIHEPWVTNGINPVERVRQVGGARHHVDEHDKWAQQPLFRRDLKNHERKLPWYACVCVCVCVCGVCIFDCVRVCIQVQV